ncbi:MAG: GNAT family N-acetyltransferase [Beijerinckiaceae bacterium]
MDEIVIAIRPAQISDVEEIVEVHDDAWRTAYRGVIPGRELERLISLRGPRWWRSAIVRGSGLLVLEFDGAVAGYVSFGRNRTRYLPFTGEIFELYVAPAHQGLGFGRRLFNVARRKLRAHGHSSTLVWALADNEPAIGFYNAMGGVVVSEARENFGDRPLDRLAFGFVGA